ncbi:EndoU domain-containing protein [Flavobacterium panici]|uniref:Uncharacterized protein n=1 Tax=Flavobacterium panici TaxID=2654843 RepID=A0A9N8J507_9FLAO|nr:EndoU domain-containing protein [Flavobacterium panici]CAC9975538.1 hypothetical protein FLAPXU55_03252 [Flavobacterium panici]
MEQAAILKSGEVIKLTGLINPKYSIYGFLNSFEADVNGVTKKFRETVKENFRDVDLVGQIDKDVIGGFYEEDFFLEYLIDKNKLYQLKDHKYTFKSASAKDVIIVKKIKVETPYTDFCKIETYKWPYQPNTQIVDYGTWQIKIPTGVFPDPIGGANVQLNNTAMQFYNHKIGLFVTPLTDVNDKQAKAFLIAKIAIQINSIENIFNTIELGTSSDFGQYINSQKSEWSTQPIFVSPSVEVFEDYMRNLTSFYEGFYANQISIRKAPKKEQFYWLARCLSAEALATVPMNDKVDLLENISDYSHRLTESNNGEQLAIKIIESFTFSSVPAGDRNDLLDRLMKIQVYQVANVYNQTNTVDTQQTLFEILYSKIDDNRSGRYYNIFNTDDNRKKFILTLYKIWKSSKYNPKYADPSYTLGANAFGLFPESYYMKLIIDSGSSIEKTKYYNSKNSPAVLLYQSFGELNDAFLSSTNIEYEIEGIKGRKITVLEKGETTITTNSPKDNNQHKMPYSYVYGIYDLFQPISIIGFKPDLDLIEFRNPKNDINIDDPTSRIPVFFLYYMQDYSNLKKIDFATMTAVEIALNLTGVGELSSLKYLNYLSKTRAVWTGAATASETVLFWEAVSGVNGLIQFTAGNALAISSYIGNTNPDPDIQKFTQKLNTFLGILTISSLVSNPFIKKRLYGAAADVLTQERKLITLGKPHGLDIDTMNAIRGIYDIDSLIDLMHLKLNNLPSYARETIITKFNSFSKDEQFAFFNYFYNVQEEGKWIKMDFKHSRIVNGEIQQYTWVDIWQNEIQFLKFYRDYDFLDAYHNITNNRNLIKHVHKGDVSVTPIPGSSTSTEITGLHNQLEIINAPPYIEGKWNFKDPLNVKENSRGYVKAKIERHMGDIIDPATNKKWENPFEPPSRKYMKAKKNESVFWPSSYSTQRINEEMAYAFSKKISRPSKQINTLRFESKATDGQKIIITKDKYGKWSIFPDQFDF